MLDYRTGGNVTAMIFLLLPALFEIARELANFYVVIATPIFLCFRTALVEPWALGLFNVMVELACLGDWKVRHVTPHEDDEDDDDDEEAVILRRRQRRAAAFLDSFAVFPLWTFLGPRGSY